VLFENFRDVFLWEIVSLDNYVPVEYPMADPRSPASTTRADRSGVSRKASAVLASVPTLAPTMRVCLAAGLLVHSVVAQFGTIRIDWVSEGALGDGRATPHVGGLSAEVEGEEPAAPPAPSADTYEEAWWRDDFAHDPPGVWFGAATTQRGKRPASMVEHHVENKANIWPASAA